MSDRHMLFTDWIGGAIDTGIGIVVGAIATLLSRASTGRVRQMEMRLSELEKESRTFVTKSELMSAIAEIRVEIRDGLNPIRESLVHIQNAMMERK